MATGCPSVRRTGRGTVGFLIRLENVARKKNRLHGNRATETSEEGRELWLKA